MSKATKSKYVVREVLDEYPVPDDKHVIMRVTQGLGNNLIEVESPDGIRVLTTLPAKFQHTIWIKKGDHVMIEYVEAVTKVQADITHILYPNQIKFLKKKGLWPAEFPSKSEAQAEADAESQPPPRTKEVVAPNSDSEAEDMSDVFVNRNRRVQVESDVSESEDESE
ncbi:hypothetical protein SARC_11112 [Sphaeroforma arctica JP610]|uniref:S1-like domain-containing protein n=1 Tax=Sphaeroforma arctica JP610 TaxID=667725 RepID=A0A0L0FHX0_9EUKA|nr:hypothetical protein SARC_11112 [Sphaeroforma arctica JP610]KNC76384.1 hypothetical protein SARC_11112 [Sphaeroforma arctica JP610]|eukprot:XP_014150286.1 hypothetical protein SARC_11112 [Sphaeroforma arctica JP610]